MNKFLRIMFVLVLVAMMGATILQLFFPAYMGRQSGYGVSYGWQREIAFWDISVILILLAVNIKYDWFYLRVVLLALILGGIGIGSNHLLHFLQSHSLINGLGAAENYLLVVGWLSGWFIEKRKHRMEKLSQSA
ncbi:hypothetical protein [Streptococcus mutans]|uniref:hypothetical protein n=1 Tax=Streptococcus mutans TaxID=1309 RepID=UPI00228534A8|nr:hypothetical protein [Streptococcus mutans]MCY7122574.1 hypothetical protein [Streptococcus mutans]MDW5565850.1 hypothetical protein [Streptococcus mutans]